MRCAIQNVNALCWAPNGTRFFSGDAQGVIKGPWPFCSLCLARCSSGRRSLCPCSFLCPSVGWRLMARGVVCLFAFDQQCGRTRGSRASTKRFVPRVPRFGLLLCMCSSAYCWVPFACVAVAIVRNRVACRVMRSFAATAPWLFRRSLRAHLRDLLPLHSQLKADDLKVAAQAAERKKQLAKKRRLSGESGLLVRLCAFASLCPAEHHRLCTHTIAPTLLMACWFGFCLPLCGTPAHLCAASVLPGVALRSVGSGLEHAVQVPAHH